MTKEPKAVIDTNIFISALIGRSKTLSKIYDAFLDSLFTPVLSLPLYSEIIAVINREKFKKYFEKDDIIKIDELLKNDAIFVNPSLKINSCRDSKDNIILETAIEAKADIIVSGDKDLTILKTFRKIPIITPKQFLEYLNK